MNKYSLAFALISLAVVSCGPTGGDQPEPGAPDTVTIKADTNTTKATSNASLELVFSDSTYQLTGVAKEPNGRLLVNYPRWSDVYQYAVVEAAGDTGRRPYPNEAMNQWQPGQSGQSKWVCVQSVYFDDSGSLWVLDPAAPKMKKMQGGGAKLVKMNKQTGQPERTYSFRGVVPDSAYMNDVRVDVHRQFAYLTESKGGGIVVADLKSGKMKRLLSDHYSVKSDTAFKFIIEGREMMKDGKPVKVNSDGIALTPDGNWLYYKPLTDNKLYRVPTSNLRNWNLPDTVLKQSVEDLGAFTTTDGMIFDRTGNLYLGDLQNNRIMVVSRDHKMRTFLQDPRLIWPDSYSIAEGYLYISCSQIQKQPEYNDGVSKRTTPYTVYRLKL